MKLQVKFCPKFRGESRHLWISNFYSITRLHVSPNPQVCCFCWACDICVLSRLIPSTCKIIARAASRAKCIEAERSLFFARASPERSWRNEGRFSNINMHTRPIHVPATPPTSHQHSPAAVGRVSSMLGFFPPSPASSLFLREYRHCYSDIRDCGALIKIFAKKTVTFGGVPGPFPLAPVTLSLRPASKASYSYIQIRGVFSDGDFHKCNNSK